MAVAKKNDVRSKSTTDQKAGTKEAKEIGPKGAEAKKGKQIGKGASLKARNGSFGVVADTKGSRITRAQAREAVKKVLARA